MTPWSIPVSKQNTSPRYVWCCKSSWRIICMTSWKNVNFTRNLVRFLGYILNPGGVEMDKVETVTSWLPPKPVKEMQRFLPFANIHCQFLEASALWQSLNKRPSQRKAQDYQMEPHSPGCLWRLKTMALCTPWGQSQIMMFISPHGYGKAQYQRVSLLRLPSPI